MRFHDNHDDSAWNFTNIHLIFLFTIEAGYPVAPHGMRGFSLLVNRTAQNAGSITDG